MSSQVIDMLANIQRPPYFSQVLPVHPPPKAMESLTSYLSRLRGSNRYDSYPSFLEACFPETHTAEQWIVDCPPLSWGQLPQLARCSEQVLLRMTLYYLGRKFGFASTADHRALFRWVQSSLVDRFQFCPPCLAEDNYHRLPWRFESLKGCPIHHTGLLQSCDYCNTQIPFRVPVSGLGMCPNCGKDLGTCQTQTIPVLEQGTIQTQYEDLIYLLSPQPWEWLGADTIWFINRRLLHLRRNRHQSAYHIAKRAGRSISTIQTVGRLHSDSGVSSFKTYLQYVNTLGISWPELIVSALPSVVVERPQATHTDALWLPKWAFKASRLNPAQHKKIEQGIIAGDTGRHIATQVGTDLDVVYWIAYQRGLLEAWKQTRTKSKLMTI